jgi:hypothetical protein
MSSIIVDDYPPFEVTIQDKLGNQVKLTARDLTVQDLFEYDKLTKITDKAEFLYGNAVDLKQFHVKTIIKICNMCINDLTGNPTKEPPEK